MKRSCNAPDYNYRLAQRITCSVCDRNARSGPAAGLESKVTLPRYSAKNCLMQGSARWMRMCASFQNSRNDSTLQVHSTAEQHKRSQTPQTAAHLQLVWIPMSTHHRAAPPAA